MIKIREFIRLIVIKVKYLYYVRIYKMKISNSARIAFGAKLDKTNPKGIYIDDETYIASGVTILSHDYIRGQKLKTKIGKRCFIGMNSIIMPGIIIGDEVIVGSGSIVTKDIPSNVMVVGNPARILRKRIKTQRFGRLVN